MVCLFGEATFRYGETLSSSLYVRALENSPERSKAGDLERDLILAAGVFMADSYYDSRMLLRTGESLSASTLGAVILLMREEIVTSTGKP